MLNCREVTRLLSAAQDRSLTLKEKMSLRLHLMMCSGCRNFSGQMSAIRKISKSYAKRKSNELNDKAE
ncbi:MAG: zf-HC2 domain-containing protein [Gammaproteobacteria bacterium]|nr:zf-HC2 domain-containing protein [Gammaproteobacteria bacterium]